MSHNPSHDELMHRIARLEQQVQERDAYIQSLKPGRDGNGQPGRAKPQAESDIRFREIIEDVEEISIQGYDEHRRVIFWNQASEKLYGYTEAEALGRQLEDLIIPDPMREGVIELHGQWLERGIKIPAGELVLRHKSGADVPVFSSHVMLTTTSGREMFCIDVDLTPVKEAEKEKETLRDQLQQAQKMEAIGTLAGGIAHDFNNILFSIGGVAELLLDDLVPGSPEYDTIEEIISAVQRGSGLVKQILSFSRRSKRKKQPVFFPAILKEVTKLCRSTIPSQIELTADISNRAGHIMADPVQLHQVTMNLITNAYQAIGTNSGKISVRLEQVKIQPSDHPFFSLPPGAYACLAVSDTGSGISPDIMDKIFDPYFTTKPNGKGTGMGLATVYGIVREHGGDIRVNSRPGHETCFKVYLPQTDAVPDPAPSPPAPEKKARHRGSERILLVDDDPAITVIERRLLSRLGYRVTDRVSSPDALSLFKSDPHGFDLLITDMAMPEMTGADLAEAVLALRPDLPVIICTGFSDPPERGRAEALGVKGFLLKPVEGAKLARMVRRVLDNEG
ncbi:MAG: response regulator [Desulfobacter sp.]|nr:MAG: response regulator [Desulfobacter sp.]